MQTITIKELQIINFKGLQKLDITFNKEGETSIYGANGTGKSSIFDAFTWLLFGKDALDRRDFDIKNTVLTDLNRGDHTVTAILNIDGSTERLTRIFREKWVKRQGSELRELQGNETVYFWNEVPMQAGEFKARVESLMPENIFKLLTNALYFNQMKWTERRKILEDLAGELSEAEIDTQGKFKELLEELQNKTLEDYKKVIAVKKKTIKGSLDEISPRIEENLRIMTTELDFKGIEEMIVVVNESLAATERNMLDESKAQQEGMAGIQEHQRKLHQAKTQLNSLEFKMYNDLQEEYNKKQALISDVKGKVALLEDMMKSKRTLMATKIETNKMISEQIAELRQEWAVAKARELVFDESQFTCPTCNRDFETDNIEETKKIMQANFEAELEGKLASINLRGVNFKKEVASNEELIQNLLLDIERVEVELAAAKKMLEKVGQQQPITIIHAENMRDSAEFQAAMSEVRALSESIPEVQEVDLSELKAKKVELTLQLDGLKKELAVRDQIKNAQLRVAELKAQEKKLAQELAELEGREFDILEFTKARMDAIEARINGKFKHVSFKMFNTLINGGTEETCETLYKGVPFDSLNTAGKLVAGLDVINTLSDHYGFRAPIFVDNRESVTTVIPVESQLISLVVSAGNLTIEVA